MSCAIVLRAFKSFGKHEPIHLGIGQFQGESFFKQRLPIYQYILQLRIKLVFEFWDLFIWWQHAGTHSHIMGDGQGDDNDHDVSSIPVVAGVVNPP